MGNTYILYSQLCLSQIHWAWRYNFDLEKIQLYEGQKKEEKKRGLE